MISDYFAALPWPQAALAAAIGFAAGALTALALARRYPNLILGTRKATMTERTPRKRPRWRSPLNAGVDWLDARPPLRAAYNRLALIIAMTAFAVSAVAGSGVVYVLYQRAGDVDHLLSCFDEFASAQSSASQARSDATERRDKAAAIALVGGKDANGVMHVGFYDLIVKIGRKQKVTPAEYFDFVRSFEKYKAASDELNRVRDANPLPEPPKKVCGKATQKALAR